MRLIDGEERRKYILEKLLRTDKPLKATDFASELGVSRQSIVGDVALLRASGHDVIATAQGYLPLKSMEPKYVQDVVCIHTEEQTQEELELIIRYGGMVEDVRVQHPLYGEIVGNLYIHNQADILKFIEKTKEYQSPLLLKLTGGIHTHRITANSESELQRVIAELRDAGFLYE